MRTLNKTGLVILSSALMATALFVSCSDDETDLNPGGTSGSGGSSGSSGSAGTAGSAGSAGDAGSSGAGGTAGSGGTAGTGGTGGGGTGGTASDPDAGDGGLGDAGPLSFNCQPGAGPDGGIESACAICTTQLGLNVVNDGDQDGTCQPAPDCPDTVAAVPTGFECCAAQWNAYNDCFANEPVTSFNCTGGTPQFDLGAPGCGTEEGDLYACLGGGCP